MVRGTERGTQVYVKMFKRINKNFIKKSVISGGKIYNITQVQQRKKAVSQRLKSPAIIHNEVSRKGTIKEVNSSVNASKDVGEH